ncbi:ABC-type amino acid transport/signal transduction systems, periplasmic component/domain [Hahella chejuensis KCTC 2396]|uniref:ABC-type amino acid transport/signal transduction systems, periplasmic component/domain n=1 Tax=Hahella chejuensis (strain KCTC 2396) TaxID=349521 RepID=Q2SMX2_HAHCH|nr:transporter substrate-binding domain-containing protein [Hahella chejuensis]ABC28002.1 ABC-type amino acid transport/signal transduction systems, periplasmic component/domain [Hahella chejuensis KCTC 2396]
MLYWLRIILCLVCAAYVKAEERPRIVLANGEWKPFLSEKLPHYGFASHLVTEAFAIVGVQVEYQFFPWARAEAMVESGQIDGSLLWTQTPQREAFAYFSDVVATQDEVLFHLRSQPLEPASPSDLLGESIAVPLGSKLGVWESLVESGQVKLVSVRDIEVGMNMLLRGRVDAFPLARAVGYSALRMHFPAKEQVRITHSSTVFDQHKYRLMLSRKQPLNARFILQFNEGLGRLRDSGRYQEMEADYYRGAYDAPAPEAQPSSDD